jgi:hypothetical protein
MMPGYRGKKIWITGDLNVSSLPISSLEGVYYVDGNLDISRTKVSDISHIQVKGRTTDYDSGVEKIRHQRIKQQKLAEAQERRENEEWSEENGDDMGTRARAIKGLLQDLSEWAAKSKTAVIITNHVYDDPNEMHPSLIKKTTGGKSMIFMPSVSVQLSRKPIKEDELKTEGGKTVALQKNYVGILLRALMAKNRFIRQYLQGEIYLSFDKGVNKYYGLLDMAVGLGVIEQNGPTYTFMGEKIGYAKNFSNNKEFWEDKVIPILQEKINIEWKYSAKELEEIEREEAELLIGQ